jgi:hypothetical protein
VIFTLLVQWADREGSPDLLGSGFFYSLRHSAGEAEETSSDAMENPGILPPLRQAYVAEQLAATTAVVGLAMITRGGGLLRRYCAALAGAISQTASSSC